MDTPPSEDEHRQKRERQHESVLTIIPRLAKFLWHLVKDP
jgi:hypothetical protein